MPKYVDPNEWLAVNSTHYLLILGKALILVCLLAFDFFNHINSFYGAVAEFCTQQSCAIMSAGPG